MSLLEKIQKKSMLPATHWNFNDRFLRDSLADFWNVNLIETVPAVNIVEHKDNFNIEMAAPGMKKEDFKIEVEGDQMTISSEKETEKKEEEKNFWKKEYSYSSFSRSFTLPENANSDKVAATYKDGLLTLSIPKKEGVAKNHVKKIAVN